MLIEDYTIVTAAKRNSLLENTTVDLPNHLRKDKQKLQEYLVSKTNITSSERILLAALNIHLEKQDPSKYCSQHEEVYHNAEEILARILV